MAFHSDGRASFNMEDPLLYNVIISLFGQRIKDGDVIRFIPTGLVDKTYFVADPEGNKHSNTVYGCNSFFSSVFKVLGPIEIPSLEEMYKAVM